MGLKSDKKGKSPSAYCKSDSDSASIPEDAGRRITPDIAVALDEIAWLRSQNHSLERILGQFRDLLDAFPDPVFMKDESLAWIYANPAMLSLFQVPIQSYPGKTDAELLPSVDAAKCIASDIKTIESRCLALSEEIFPGEDGATRYFEVFKMPLFDRQQRRLQGLIGIGRDVTARKCAQRELEHSLERNRRLAEHDELTGLYNRRHFRHLLETYLAESPVPCALLLIDIDNFRYVNDSFGHERGDDYILSLSSLLFANLGTGELLARSGGDEFSLVMPFAAFEEVVSRAQTLLALFSRQDDALEKEGFSPPTVSIGISLSANADSAGELLMQADLAMHQAKAAGRNTLCFYEQGQRDDVSRRLSLYGRIKALLRQPDGLALHFQPIVDLQNGTWLKAEALLRLRGAGLDDLSPYELVTTAEQFGLMGELSRRVIEMAFSQKAAWAGAGLTGIPLSINLSGQNFDDLKLLDRIFERARHYRISPGEITFEVTESQAMRNLAKSAHFIATLQEAGFRFALDDFGVDFASFNYLKRLPVNTIKIDGSFIRDIDRCPRDQALTRAICEIAKAFGMHTVAEQVETAETLARLRAIGVDYAQGWYFAKAMPAAEFAARWADQQAFRAQPAR